MREENKASLLIGYFLAKYDLQAYEALGFQNRSHAHVELGKNLGVKPATIKNMRDQFDTMFGHRAGWHQRELTASRLNIHKKYENYSFEQLLEVVQLLISTEKVVMKVEFIKVCDFCREYPTEIHGGLPTNDPRVAEVKISLSALASKIQTICDSFSDIPLRVEHAKGAGAFPRIPYIVILPPGQKTNDGVYVSICFGKEGAGAVAGFAQSVDHPRPGFPTVVRGTSSVDVAQFNPSYANPLDILRDDFSEEKLIAHLKQSITLCLDYLGGTPLQRLIVAFRSEFPDFKTFVEPGQLFQKNEDSYKREAVSLFGELFNGWLNASPESLPGAEFSRRLILLLNKTNLVDWRTVASLNDKILKATELLPEFQTLCHQLLSKVRKGEESDIVLNKLINFMANRGSLPPAATKLIPTYLLMLAQPAEYIFIKPSIVATFFKELGYQGNLDETVFCAEAYHIVQNRFKEIATKLKEIAPRDMIDLQSFYFVVVKAEEGEGQGVKKDKEMSVSKLVEACTSDVSAVNIRLADSFLARFISALASKPFVILTGLSGSGKSMLAQAFTHWLVPEAQRCFVPVGADWTNNEHLLGYANALDPMKYVMPDTGVLTLLLDANKNPAKPFFLVLDEMNLSHVERYFADFLSVMESGEKIHLYKGELRKPGEVGEDIPRELEWPKNLFIIGTVNIDETTYMFSPKVLDRAQVIEFRVSQDEMSAFLDDPPPKTDMADWDDEVYAYETAFLAQARKPDIKAPPGTVAKLNDFFGPLAEVGAEFGYRTANEFLRFVGQYMEFAGKAELDKVVDFAIMQKLLPKLHGSKRRLRGPLSAIWFLCLKDGAQMKLMDSKGIKFNEVCKYPVSAEKISRMYFNAEENGFTSYAEA